MTTKAHTEYSIRYPDGTNSAWGVVQYAGFDTFALPNELPRLQSELRGTGATLLKRTVTTGEPEPVPEYLPTAYGSVISAVHGNYTRALFARENIEFGDNFPWVRLDTYGERWVASEDLSDVHVLFDAAEVGRE